MDGSFSKNNNEYEYWAGPANPDAEEDYCVHCRRGDWGVTQYIAQKPSAEQAEQLAMALAPHVDALQQAA